jgi:hypothetical protein
VSTTVTYEVSSGTAPGNMEITVSRSGLLRELAASESVVERKPTLPMSERYFAHWIDFGGGRYSETLGYGKRVGNEIDFVFEYPDGPFRTDFIWDSPHGKWHWQMTQKNASGQWTSFADLTLMPNGKK